MLCGSYQNQHGVLHQTTGSMIPMSRGQKKSGTPVSHAAVSVPEKPEVGAAEYVINHVFPLKGLSSTAKAVAGTVARMTDDDKAAKPGWRQGLAKAPRRSDGRTGSLNEWIAAAQGRSLRTVAGCMSLLQRTVSSDVGPILVKTAGGGFVVAGYAEHDIAACGSPACERKYVEWIAAVAAAHAAVEAETHRKRDEQREARKRRQAGYRKIQAHVRPSAEEQRREKALAGRPIPTIRLVPDPLLARAVFDAAQAPGPPKF